MQKNSFSSLTLKCIYVNLSDKTLSYVLFVRREKVKPHKLRCLVGRQDKCLWLKVHTNILYIYGSRT